VITDVARRRLLGLAPGVVLLVAASWASADVRLEVRSEVDAFTIGGRPVPARAETSTVWVGDDRLRVDEGDRTTLVRLDERAVYLVDRSVGAVARLEMPVDPRRLLPEGVADRLLANSEYVVTVRSADEVRDVGRWACRGWDVTMTAPRVTVGFRVWTTDGLPLDRDMFLALWRHVWTLQPGFDRFADALAELDGVMVARETATVGDAFGGVRIRSSSEVTDAAIVEVVGDHYDVPEQLRPVEPAELRWLEGTTR
jgi:hypothetical protein